MMTTAKIRMTVVMMNMTKIKMMTTAKIRMSVAMMGAHVPLCC